MIIPTTVTTINPDDSVCANNSRIAITLNIDICINGVKYDPTGSKDDASGTNADEDESKEGEEEEGSDKATEPIVRIYTKAAPNLSLTIREGKVVLATSNPSDPNQYWIKYITSVKDEEGYSSFSLVNKATGQAIKHSIGHDYDVQLITYNPNKLDYSILWTSKDMGDSYMTIRNVNNITLILDAWNGDNYGVRDGTKIILLQHLTGDNQRWRIISY